MSRVAHPDPQGFGRRTMPLATAGLETTLMDRVAALAGMAAAERGRLVHVKPHGAANR